MEGEVEIMWLMYLHRKYKINWFLKQGLSQVWWHKAGILPLENWCHDDLEFKVSLKYTKTSKLDLLWGELVHMIFSEKENGISWLFDKQKAALSSEVTESYMVKFRS